MRKGWHVAWAVIGVLSAISVAHDWYSGEPAHTPVWILAIVGALSVSVSAVERIYKA